MTIEYALLSVDAQVGALTACNAVDSTVVWCIIH